MDFVEAIRKVYEKDAVIGGLSVNLRFFRKSLNLRRLSFDKTEEAIYQNYSLLSDAESLNNDWVVTNEYDYFIARDNLVRGKLPVSNKKRRR